MEANVIWYRSRSEKRIVDALEKLLESVGARIVGEQTTIRPELFSGLLAQALGSGDITVIIGGLDQRSESDNTVFLLSKCVPMPLEYDSKSRSTYVYDNFRAKVLPSFSQAVLFPSKNGGAEGFVMCAGKKTIIVLPWFEEEHSDMVELMQQYLPAIIFGEEALKEKEEEARSSEPPAYIRIANERRMRREEDERRHRDMILSAEQVRRMFSKSIADDEEPDETNRRRINPAPVQNSPEPERRFEDKVPKGKNSGIKFIGRASIILIMTVVLAVVSIIGFLYYEPVELSDGKGYQSELAELYADTDERGELPFGALTRFARLYAINSDIRGFLSIEGTELAQPVMLSPQNSPKYYSSYDFYKNESPKGSLHLDVSNLFNSENDSYFNTVVYGNSPADGSLFAELHNYTNGEYIADHPIINFDTLYRSGEWIVFAVCCVSGDTVEEFNYANTDFSAQYAIQIHLYNLYIRSMFYTQTEVLPTDRILTLVTESKEFNGAKLIVCAREVREGEDISYAGRNVAQNVSCLMPEMWYKLTGESKPDVPKFVLPQTTTTTTTTVPTLPEGETTTSDPNGNPTTLPAPSVSIEMRITTGGKVISGSAQEILAMIIEAEMGSEYELEALKAQAVASYTYYLYSGGSAKAPSFPTKTPGEKAIEAANAVAGQFVSYNGIPVYTPYFDVSAGCTADNADINGTAIPYLVSADCSVDKKAEGYRTVIEASSFEVRQKVLEKKGIDLGEIENKKDWFEIISRDANDLYVTKISVGGKEMRGHTLYMSVLGSSFLRSACFYIEYDEVLDVFTFTSLGNGSGVGMSQKGANEYAKQGKNYVWILEHFYFGTEISQ